MATFSNAPGMNPSTIDFRLGTVTIARGSTNELQELICLADPDSSNAVAKISAGALASTTFGLAVRLAGGPSSAADVAIRTVPSSTNTDNPVRAWQGVGNSSGADAWAIAVVDSSNAIVKPADSANNAIRVNVVAGAAAGSTIVTVSTIVGVVTVRPEASSNSSVYMPVRITNGTAFLGAASDYTDGSTYTDLTGPGLVFNNSSNNTMRLAGLTTPFPVQVTDSSNAAVKVGDSVNNGIRVNLVARTMVSTSAPSSNSSGSIVRQVVDNQVTTASTNAFASTSLSVMSSAANLRAYVTGYTITTTNAGPIQVGFYSSGTLLWPIVLATPSSAITGANLAVGQPGYLFRTGAGEALTLQMNGSTIAGWVAGVSYYVAP